MYEKRYEVYINEIKYGSDMSLDGAFCLVRGFADIYFNESLDVTIKEMKTNKCQNNDEYLE